MGQQVLIFKEISQNTSFAIPVPTPYTTEVI